MRVPIAQRPKRVDSRHEFGHFESDTVIGTAPSKRCIDTQVERKSRRLFARFIEDKSALATARAEYDIYKDIPAPARIDRTWDNGTESSCHLLVDEALGMLTYYANPYSSYQCVCSIESGPCERVDVFHVSGRFWSTSACGEKRTPARPAWTSFPS